MEAVVSVHLINFSVHKIDKKTHLLCAASKNPKPAQPPPTENPSTALCVAAAAIAIIAAIALLLRRLN